MGQFELDLRRDAPMELSLRHDKSIQLDNARIIFRNFEGKEGMYNREGDRNFAVVLDAETAEILKKEGWNVKTKPGRQEGEEDRHTLSVAVSYKGRPPRLVMLTSRGRTTLDEETCEAMDWIDLLNCDLIIRPYDWKVNGNEGRKAYLKTMFAKIDEDELELRYADVPEIGEVPPKAELEAGQDPEDFLEGEVVDDSEWTQDGDRRAIGR